jgi:molybdopterin synthase catalytic subunit
VTFIGTVRDFSEVPDEEGQVSQVGVKQLNYECYKDMALRELDDIRKKALTSFNIDDMHIIHRVGEFKPADQIVMIAVSAAHRKEAFRACEYAIDELKKNVPIWKKEITVSGEHWVGSEDEYGEGGDK